MMSPIVLLPSNRLQTPGGPPPRFGIADAFARRGFAAEVIDVNALPRNPFFGRASLYASIDPWRAVTVLLRRRCARAVISYYQSGALLILALRRWLGFRPPVIIVDVGDDTNWPMRARIVAYCLKRADAVFSFSRDQVADLAARHPGVKVHFLPQQIDTRFFSPVSGEGEYILSVGGDVSRDYATLAAAVFDLGQPVVLRTDLVTPDPSRPHVTIASRGSEEDLRTLYRKARIVVVPLLDMRHPGGITTLLEAFACGKPVVVSDARGVRDYLLHEQNCLVVPCGDVEAMRSAVVRLLDDAGLRDRLGRAARQYAVSELSQDRYAARLMEFLTPLQVRG